MSKIVNETWNYSTLFVRLSEISPVFENGFTFLISNFGIYSDTLRRTERMFIKHNIDTGVSSSSHVHAPVWVHCNCGSKAPTKIINADDGLALVGICMSCKKDLRLSLGSQDDPDLSKAIRDVSPRAIPIPLLLSRDLGISCYASGTGGLGYLVDGSVIGKRLGIDFPPVLVWPSRDIYSGIGQAEAIASIRAMEIKDIDAHLEILRRRSKTYEERIMPLLAERSEKTSIGEPVDKLLAQLFTLKEEQRKIRRHISTVERIRNAVSISPCIVDYAVNFGIVTAEKTWRNHLEHNGNLSSHVQFSQT
jgi:hypothetical protein